MPTVCVGQPVVVVDGAGEESCTDDRRRRECVAATEQVDGGGAMLQRDAGRVEGGRGGADDGDGIAV